MSRVLKTSAIALLALLTFVPAVSVHPPRTVVRPRVIIVQPLYSPFYDPFYDPFYYRPYYAPAPTMGEVKIETHMKDAQVYVDGGYAGLAGKLKKFSLSPGIHTIERRDNEGHMIIQQRVAVIAGKTIKIEA